MIYNKQTTYQTFSIVAPSDDEDHTSSSYRADLHSLYPFDMPSSGNHSDNDSIEQNDQTNLLSKLFDREDNVNRNKTRRRKYKLRYSLQSIKMKFKNDFFCKCIDTSLPSCFCLSLNTNIVCSICSCLSIINYHPTLNQLNLVTIILQILIIVCLMISINLHLYISILLLTFFWCFQTVIIIQSSLLIIMHLNRLSLSMNLNLNLNQLENNVFSAATATSKITDDITSNSNCNDVNPDSHIYDVIVLPFNLFEICISFFSCILIFAGLYLTLDYYSPNSTFEIGKNYIFLQGQNANANANGNDNDEAYYQIVQHWLMMFYYSTSQQTLTGIADVRPLFIPAICFASLQFFIGLFFAIFIISFALSGCRALHKTRRYLEIQRMGHVMHPRKQQQLPKLFVKDDLLDQRSEPETDADAETEAEAEPELDFVVKKKPVITTTSKQSQLKLKLKPSVETEDIENEQNKTHVKIQIENENENENETESVLPLDQNQNPITLNSDNNVIASLTITKPIKPRQKKYKYVKARARARATTHNLWNAIIHNRRVRRSRRFFRQHLLLIVLVVVISKLIVYDTLQAANSLRVLYILVLSLITNCILFFISSVVSMKFITSFVYAQQYYSYSHFHMSHMHHMHMHLPIISLRLLIQLYFSCSIIFAGLYVDIQLYSGSGSGYNMFEIRENVVDGKSKNFIGMVMEYIYYSLSIVTLGGSHSITHVFWYTLVLTCIEMLFGFLFQTLLFAWGLMKLSDLSSNVDIAVKKNKRN